MLLFLKHFDSLTDKKGKGISPKNRSWRKQDKSKIKKKSVKIVDR